MTEVVKNDISVTVLTALRDGEEWAYDEVYKRFASPVKDFLSLLIRNEEDARELNHDLFLSVWANRDKIVPERGIRGFLYMRAKNLAMNYFDHKKVAQKYADFRRHHQVDFSWAPDQQMIGDEAQILVDIALQGMSERKRNIFLLKYEQGRSVDEIAAELNISTSTVKNNLTAITQALRKIFSLYIIIFLS
jgi:RNA polymerase sigma-70 factor (ECF subfamily)